MAKELPNVQYHDEIHCQGSFLGELSSLVDPIVTILIPNHEYPANMRFTSRFRDIDGFELYYMLQDASRSVEFSGVDEGGNPLRFEARWNAVNGNTLRGRVYLLDENVRVLRETPGKQIVVGRLSPTNLALPEVPFPVRYWTGERKADGADKKRLPFNFATDFGECEFSLHYSYEKALVGGEESELMVPTPSLALTVLPEKRTSDVRMLLAGFQSHLAPFERILSFLSRRHVQLSRIEVESSEFPSMKTIHQARRRLKGASSPAPHAPLVWAHDMEPSALNQVVKAYLTSPYTQVISLTIDYLIARWRGDTLESLATTAFTAFETLINGISNIDRTAETLSDQDFKGLRQHLETATRTYAKDHGIAAPVRKEIYAKFSELQRRGVVSRAAEFVERFDVDWVDLFEADKSLRQALGDAYARRSRLIHVGKVDDFGALYADTNRIHALTERCIFTILNGDPGWIAVDAYSHVR